MYILLQVEKNKSARLLLKVYNYNKSTWNIFSRQFNNNNNLSLRLLLDHH